MEKLALVVEGGAMRGIFSAGVLDAFIVREYNPFDLCIGVSAGANNITSLLAGEYKRSYKVYTDYNRRKEFINWKRYIRGGHLLDLDWLWDITNNDMPLDKKKIVNNKSEFYVGITDVKTGQIKYVKPVEQDIDDILKASCCIPIFYRKFINLNDEFYVDGGIADPIPVIEAANKGAKTIVVLRSRPYSYKMKSNKNRISDVVFKKYPELKQSLKLRSEIYNKTIEYMRSSKDINIIEINPPDCFKTKRLTKNLSTLEKDYQYGYEMGCELVNQLINNKVSK